MSNTTARLQHPAWPEYIKDAPDHWSNLIDISDCTDETELNELIDRFRHTFFPELP